jgi:putative endopeptidase
MRKILFAFCATVATLGIAATSFAADAPHFGSWGFDLSAMDTSVKPGDDFNRYASGTWLARTEIPADKAILSLRVLQSDAITAQLRDLLQAAAAHPDLSTLEGKAGAFFTSFMDEGRVRDLGWKPLRTEIAAINAARDRAALAHLMGQAQAGFYASIYGVGVDIDLKNVSAYAVSLTQNGIGLPDRDYYLEASFAAQKAAYQVYIAKLLSLLGWKEPQQKAAAIVDLETRIAKVSWTEAEQRDLLKTYNAMTRKELEDLAPGFAWGAFLDGAGLGTVQRVIVHEKSAIAKIAEVYQSTPLGVLKAWQAFSVVDNAGVYLSDPFASARFEFRGHRLFGQPAEEPRWKLAVRAVGDDCHGERTDCFGNMGYGVGQMYAARYFPPAAKIKIEALIQNIKAAMRARLEHLDWMSAATRAEALAKLDTYQIKVGYPDHPRTYQGLTIRADDLIGNVRRSAAWEWNFQVTRLHAPVDRSDWLMFPQTNDAYNGPLRDIVFPAGFLQPPVFDPNADPAINYGAIGVMIGHELTHGFDDEGRKLDAKGELRDWWTAEDEAQFRARAAKLGQQFSAFEPLPGVHVNGALTMGENIADLGGLNIALDAYHRSLDGQPAAAIDGFSGDQRFYLGWAQAWRGKPRDDFIRHQVVSDPHSPRMFRVIGPLRNLDAWYRAFGVKPEDKYYLAPDQRVFIW